DRPRRSANRRSNSRSGIPPVSSPRRSASAPGSSRKSRLTASSSSPLSRQNSAKLSQTEVVSTPPKSTRRPVWVPSARIGFAVMGDEAIGEAVVARCADEAVNGAPFYVMEFVEGPILRSRADAEGIFEESERAAIGERVVDTLVAIHAVDPDEVGLGELGRRQDYVARQLRRWQ